MRKKQEQLVFAFVGKSGIEHEIVVDDPDVGAVIDLLRRRRGGGEELLAFKDGRLWRDVTAEGVNAYLLELFGGDVTAKDFRTWHATVIAATVLAENPNPAETKTARRKAIRQAVVEVSEYLGNTPAIARNSYVDPRVLDLYEDGTTIAAALRKAPRNPQRRQEHLEKAVLRMLSVPRARRIEPLGCGERHDRPGSRRGHPEEPVSRRLGPRRRHIAYPNADRGFRRASG